MSHHHDAVDGWPAPGRYCSSCDEDTESCSDDGPLLAYKFAKSRSYDEKSKAVRRRSCPCSIIRKIFIICGTFCLLCIILYIPLYIRAIGQVPVPENDVDGWSLDTNRDTKLYIKPGFNTTLLNTRIVCQKYTKEKLYLLIIVTSAPKHFDKRNLIRNSWGHYEFYKKYSKISTEMHEKYKNYNYTSLFYPDLVETVKNISKRDISINDLIPKIAEALSNNNYTDIHTNSQIKNEEKNRDDVLPEFDMNKQFGDKENIDDEKENIDTAFGAYDYDYESNVMKIPPKGYEENVETSKIIDKLKQSYATLVKSESEPKVRNIETAKPMEKESSDVEFKVVFILGLPNVNDTEVDVRIKDESIQYGDIIQENFTDTYNNLTLKSIMMLKWVTSNCYDNVNYVMKTDDDMFINVVNLMRLLRKETADHERRLMSSPNAKHYLLIGDSIRKAKPNLNTSNKWYSPRYMYSGAVYPDYLSGTGYVMSLPTVHSLYSAALFAPYFHLEDIYITGICAKAARPTLVPRGAPGFSLSQRHAKVGCRGLGFECAAHADITLHALPAQAHASILASLLSPKCVDICERIHQTEVRKQILTAKKRTKH